MPVVSAPPMGIAVYRIYLRHSGQKVSDKSNTSNPQTALTAFEALVNRMDLDGQKLAAVLSYNNEQLAYHRFDRQPGDADYWRDRLQEIDMPREGRPLEMADGKRRNVYIDDESWARAVDLGNGNASEGIRIALRRRSKS